MLCRAIAFYATIPVCYTIFFYKLKAIVETRQRAYNPYSPGVLGPYPITCFNGMWLLKNGYLLCVFTYGGCCYWVLFGDVYM
jgi:hypothetical protein